MKVQLEVDITPVVKAVMRGNETTIVVQGLATYGEGKASRTVTGTVPADQLPPEAVQAVEVALQGLLKAAQDEMATVTMRARNEAEQVAVRLGEI